VSSTLDLLVRESVEEMLPRLIEIRQNLHAHPQLAFEETYSSALVRRVLGEFGVTCVSGVGGTGVVGWLVPPTGHGVEGVALRADLDALPIQETSTLPYASQYPGRMHACGHDGHTTMLLGAACVLSRLRDRLRRPVKFLFQPAEETGRGARRLIEAGALDERMGEFRVGSAFGVHGWPDLPQGVVATRSGPLMASTDVFQITVSGRGGHGSAPHAAIDPILAAAHVVTAIQSVVSRNVHPLLPAVVTVGSFVAGDAANVIPDEAKLSGTIRTLDDATAALARRRLQDLAESVARAYGAEATVEFPASIPTTSNDSGAVQYWLEVARSYRDERTVVVLDDPVMASEDFSEYGRLVPSCFFFVGLRRSGDRSPDGLHTPNFDFNDAVLADGVELFCRLVLHDG
jgi:amidohydrolase